MSPESAAETGARVAEALNLLGLVALEGALRTCLAFFTAVTRPVPGVDLALVKERLTVLLASPALFDLQRPAALAEHLRGALAAMGCPAE